MSETRPSTQGRPLGTGHAAMVFGLSELLARAQKHLYGERDLTDQEWDLLNDIHAWWSEYLPKAAARRASDHA